MFERLRGWSVERRYGEEIEEANQKLQEEAYDLLTELYGDSTEETVFVERFFGKARHYFWLTHLSVCDGEMFVLEEVVEDTGELIGLEFEFLGSEANEIGALSYSLLPSSGKSQVATTSFWEGLRTFSPGSESEEEKAEYYFLLKGLVERSDELEKIFTPFTEPIDPHIVLPK